MAGKDNIYEPLEDSYFLQESVRKRFSQAVHKACLDMGTGSGIIARTLRSLGAENVVAIDISRGALKSQKGRRILSDLFSGTRGKFDFIMFNPPYLPDDGGEPDPATIGGKNGYETAMRFLDQLPEHLTPKGECLLLISSHTNPGAVESFMRSRGLRFRIISRRKLFFEELFVYLVRLRP